MMRLSICIPTYNRSRFISDLIDSIIAQSGYQCEIEVVVSDNASSDATRNVVEGYRSRLANLVYHRATSNMGADRNFLKVVELASGDFCWLMGDDDVLEPNAIRTIEASILAHPHVAGLTVNRNAYSFDLEEKLVERPVAGGTLRASMPLYGADKIFSTLGEYFGFISGQVVRRSIWQNIVVQPGIEQYFNAYVHVYVIGRMLQQNPEWYYIVDRCVGWRSGNDSFLSEGVFRRMMIDVVGLEKIARDLFGIDSSTYHDLNRTVGSVHVRYALTSAKLSGLPNSFFLKSWPILLRHYWRYGAFWTKTVPVLILPAGLLHGARWLYRNTIKSRYRRVDH